MLGRGTIGITASNGRLFMSGEWIMRCLRMENRKAVHWSRKIGHECLVNKAIKL